jgi:hypothetical protein
VLQRDLFYVNPVGNALKNLDAVLVSYPSLRPYLEILRGTEGVSVLNIPMCQNPLKSVGVDTVPLYFMTESIQENEDMFVDKVQTPGCVGCKHLPLCGGVPKVYLDKFGRL